MYDRLLAMLEPVVEGLGYELLEIEFQPRGRDGLLRLYIDQPAGITLDDCERVSNQVSAVLDVEDPIPGAYSLEVSSPGLDRPLRTAAHFAVAVGSRVRIELQLPRDGRKRFTGNLLVAEDDKLVVEVDGTSYTLALQEVAKARVVPTV